MLKIDLEEQYKLYLERMNLHENKMHPEQKKQLKETFYGATGQILILMRDEITVESEAEGAAVLQDMLNQVGNFFIKETNKQN